MTFLFELKELVSLHQSVCVSVNAWVHFLLLFHKSILIINKVGFGLAVVIIIGLNNTRYCLYWHTWK